MTRILPHTDSLPRGLAQNTITKAVCKQRDALMMYHDQLFSSLDYGSSKAITVKSQNFHLLHVHMPLHYFFTSYELYYVRLTKNKNKRKGKKKKRNTSTLVLLSIYSKMNISSIFICMSLFKALRFTCCWIPSFLSCCQLHLVETDASWTVVLPYHLNREKMEKYKVHYKISYLTGHEMARYIHDTLPVYYKYEYEYRWICQLSGTS